MALFAYLTDTSGLQWLDLALLPALGIAWVLLALIWPAILLKPMMWLAAHTIYRMKVIGWEHIPHRPGPAFVQSRQLYRLVAPLGVEPASRPVHRLGGLGEISPPGLVPKSNPLHSH